MHGKPVQRILVVQDASLRPALDAQTAQVAFGLSAAELRVASLLVGGKSLAQIASGLGVSANTAKSHLSRLFAKTGTSRQAELVSQLLAFCQARSDLGSIATEG